MTRQEISYLSLYQFSAEPEVPRLCASYPTGFESNRRCVPILHGVELFLNPNLTFDIRWLQKVVR